MIVTCQESSPLQILMTPTTELHKTFQKTRQVRVPISVGGSLGGICIYTGLPLLFVLTETRSCFLPHQKKSSGVVLPEVCGDDSGNNGNGGNGPAVLDAKLKVRVMSIDVGA